MLCESSWLKQIWNISGLRDAHTGRVLAHSCAVGILHRGGRLWSHDSPQPEGTGRGLTAAVGILHRGLQL